MVYSIINMLINAFNPQGKPLEQRVFPAGFIASSTFPADSPFFFGQHQQLLVKVPGAALQLKAEQ